MLLSRLQPSRLEPESNNQNYYNRAGLNRSRSNRVLQLNVIEVSSRVLSKSLPAFIHRVDCFTNCVATFRYLAIVLEPFPSDARVTQHLILPG